MFWIDENQDNRSPQKCQNPDPHHSGKRFDRERPKTKRFKAVVQGMGVHYGLIHQILTEVWWSAFAIRQCQTSHGCSYSVIFRGNGSPTGLSKAIESLLKFMWPIPVYKAQGIPPTTPIQQTWRFSESGVALPILAFTFVFFLMPYFIVISIVKRCS